MERGYLISKARAVEAEGAFGDIIIKFLLPLPKTKREGSKSLRLAEVHL